MTYDVNETPQIHTTPKRRAHRTWRGRTALLAVLTLVMTTLSLVATQAAQSAPPPTPGTTMPTAALSAAAAARAAGRADAVPPGLTTTPVVTGLDLPVTMRFAGNDRIYVALKKGVVQMYDGAGDKTPTTTLDVRRQTYTLGDRGLLGLALDPQFDAGRPYLYALISYDRDPFGTTAMPRWGGANDNDPCPTPPGANGDGCTTSGLLTRYTVGADGVADPASAKVLLDGATDPSGGWCHQFPSHSIGTVEFGTDGMLYVGSGDGASYNAVDYGQYGGSAGSPTPANPCNDRPGGRGTALVPATSTGGAVRSQAVRAGPATGYVTWDGAILRINPDTGAAAAGNPLLGNGIAGDDRIVAYGLRNPYRFGFRPGTNELWLGDVGWNTYEEINRFVTGPQQSTVPNFGWPCYEGNARQGGYDAANIGLCERLYASTTSSLGGVSSPLTAPVYAWPRTGEEPAPGCSSSGGGAAAGGPFVTSTAWPTALQGAYVFADYARSCIALLPLTGGQPDPTRPMSLVTGAAAVSIQQGPGGDLYYADIAAGSIVRIRPTSGNLPPVAAFTATPDAGAPPLTVHLDASATRDPNSLEQLTYAWDLDGDGDCDDATGQTLDHTFTTAGTVAVTLCVRDQLGETGTVTHQIRIGNDAPVVTVTSSADAAGWKVGDAITFTATATDPQDGPLPAAAFGWTFEIRHCTTEAEASCHTHPLSGASGPTATITAPDHEYYAYVRATVKVTDSGGSTTTVTHDAQPRISTITLATDPAGLPVSAGPASGTSPLTARFLENGVAQLIVPQTADQGGTQLTFAGWTDGSSAGPIRDVRAPAGSTTYTARYTGANAPPAVTGITVSPSPTAIGWQGKTFTLTARVADASGVGPVTGRLTVPGSPPLSTTMTRRSGTATDGTYSGQIYVSYAAARTGLYPTSVTAVDTLGASATVNGPDASVRRMRCILIFCS